MLTSEQFIDKIEQILNYYNLSASLFAEKIGVQRSSLSHLLSGRNKPSLDFVIKIVEEFPEVDLYWFLFNQGNFPREEEKGITIAENRVFEKKNFENTNNEILNREILPLDLFNSEDNKSKPENLNNNSHSYNSTTQNNTFDENKIQLTDEISKNPIVENKSERKTENTIPNNVKENEISPVVNNFSIPEIKTNPKIRKLILIYEDGFFEEYNYR